MMSRIDSRHWTISTGRPFQNGSNNITKIQHCPISSHFEMRVDNDVPNWFPQCRESIQDIIIYPHIKFWWYRTMLNFCGIVVAILKMATSRNCSMSGINSGHHYLPLKFNIVRFQRHFICGQIMMPRIDSWHWKISTGHHFQNANHNIEKIQHSIRDIIIYPHIITISISGINSGHHYLPTFQIVMILDNVEYLPYCGDHFENGPQYRKNSTLSEIITIWYVGR
jgi:hypothetical protein